PFCDSVTRTSSFLLLWMGELHHASNTSAAPPGSSSGADGSLYILAHILAYTRWQKLESKHDPYHPYIERDWGSGNPAQGAEKDGPPPRSSALESAGTVNAATAEKHCNIHRPNYKMSSNIKLHLVNTQTF
uniref:Uncharacterized protein n=1 Tax=Cyanistes caeruleus TaxID=156563 RepID=A0A8C0VLP0_CYACU